MIRGVRSLAIAIQDFNGSRANCSSNARITQISEHNANLSRYFCSLLSGRGIAERLGPLPLIHGDNWRWNGIVSLWKDCDAVASALSKEKFSVSTIYQETSDDRGNGFLLKRKNRMNEYELAISGGLDYYDQNGVPPQGCCRICFHYYHEATHVERLVDGIVEALK